MAFTSLMAPKPYRRSLWRRGLNALVRPLARHGLTGPRTYLLTVPGRASGKLWSTPVTLVEESVSRATLSIETFTVAVRVWAAAGTTDSRTAAARKAPAVCVE